MGRLDDEEVIRAAAARLYGTGQDIWKSEDRWNSWKRARIDAFARRYVTVKLEEAKLVLDLGCGCQPYRWLPSQTISLDRFPKQVRGAELPVVGDVERLPFKDGLADFVVCVASVLNYVSAVEAIVEFARVLKHGAWLLLHFETSTSFEHVGTGYWGAAVRRLETINGGEKDTLWVYNPSFIISTLKACRFNIIRTQQFHTLSSLGLRIGLNQQKAATMAALDSLSLPFAKFADDFILIAEKT